LLGKNVNDHLLWLVLLDRSEQHLDEDYELFVVASLVRDLLDVSLLEVATPDQSLHLRLNVDN